MKSRRRCIGLALYLRINSDEPPFLLLCLPTPRIIPRGRPLPQFPLPLLPVPKGRHRPWVDMRLLRRFLATLFVFFNQKNTNGPTLFSPLPAWTTSQNAFQLIFQGAPFPSDITILNGLTAIGTSNGCKMISHPKSPRRIYEAKFEHEENIENMLTNGVIINNIKIRALPPRPKQLPRDDTTGQQKNGCEAIQDGDIGWKGSSLESRVEGVLRCVHRY